MKNVYAEVLFSQFQLVQFSSSFLIFTSGPEEKHLRQVLLEFSQSNKLSTCLSNYLGFLLVLNPSVHDRWATVVIFWFIIRSIYLVFIPVSGTELLKPLTFLVIRGIMVSLVI